MRGAFIVLEGVDRSGKTTQTKLLAEKLQASGKAVEVFRFPCRTTEIGGLLNSFLSKGKELPPQVAHLLFAANRWECIGDIRNKLERGVSVICDRYAHSGVAYTHGALGLDLEWCKGPERGLLQPDAVFQLEISPEAAAGRSEFGQERYEKLDIQHRVMKAYSQLSIGEDYWWRFDAAVEQEVLTEQLFQTATTAISSAAGAEMCKLWEAAASENSR